jgi:FG-GAP-like repeat
MKFSVFSFQFSAGFAVLLSSFLQAGEDRKNWVAGAEPGIGTFEKTESVAYPWGGVDSEGFLRKSVSVPSTNPFVTKSNQFSYAFLGSSASLVDIDGDGLPDIVSPDGNGIFWCWKNIGAPGNPAFGSGEAMPLLVDDLRSEFVPIFNPQAGKAGSAPKKELTPSQKAEKRRVDDKRDRELDKQLKNNERLPKDKQEKKKDIEKRVEELFPYGFEKDDDAGPSSGSLALPSTPIPAGGLTCTMNSFRRLRLVASPGDWNGDKLTDFIIGDSGGTVYFAPNTGRPGQPNFGYLTRLSNSIPLKVARVPGPDGKLPVFQPVEFMNYAMPFVCDWDGDGIPDLLVGEGTYSVNSIRLFHNASRATPQNPPKETILYVGEDRTFLAPFAYDWDGDGKLELFVCDAKGRLTVHRRPGGIPPASGVLPSGSDAPLDDPQDITLDGGNAPLAYCAPQPCDWNADGIMDLIWGDPFGRIMVALGKQKGGLEFSAPFAVRSAKPPVVVQFPASRISAAAVPARAGNDYGGPPSNGGTAGADSYYATDGSQRINIGGWPGNANRASYGLMPSWSASSPPTLENALGRDSAGKSKLQQPSWAIAPVPGDVWEVVDEPGAPGDGKTFLLRWHDAHGNSIFKSRPPRLSQWTPGASVAFRSGRSGPFCAFYTKEPITIKFQMKLDGAFSRLDMIFDTNWGPLGGDKKPPELGGDFSQTMAPPPTGKWFEFSFTQPPDKKYERGLDGTLFIELLGEGEVRIRDVRVYEGK